MNQVYNIGALQVVNQDKGLSVLSLLRQNFLYNLHYSFTILSMAFLFSFVPALLFCGATISIMEDNRTHKKEFIYAKLPVAMP